MNNRFFLISSARSILILITLILLQPLAFAEQESTKLESGYLGSSKCRSCHEKFYRLWAPSHHGLAMQPYTEAFAQENLKPQLDEVIIGKTSYRAVINEGPGFVVESRPAICSVAQKVSSPISIQSLGSNSPKWRRLRLRDRKYSKRGKVC